MTNFGTLTNALTRRKVQIINHLLVIDIIAILLTILYEVYQGNLNVADPLLITTSYSVLVYMVAFVLVARNNEQIYVNDSYRLVPISDTGLYSANLLSAFISMLYLVFTQIAFGVIAAAMNFREVFHAIMLFLKESSPVGDKGAVIGALFGFILLMAVFAIFSWISISLVHLITSALTAFLPDSRSRLYRFILYVVVIAAFIYILSKIMNPIGDVFYGMADENSYYQLYLASISLLVVSGLESAANVYLLRAWVETTNR